MKRYTGQQALYEAISRSRDKAKHGSGLEKLRPEPTKQASPAVHEPQPQTEAQQAPVEAPEPVVQEPAEPQVVETPPKPVVELERQVQAVQEVQPEPVVKAATEPPVEREEPAARLRPVERAVHPVPPSRVQTWLRPRPVQFNEGRIEVSVPYYVGVIAGLAVIVFVLAAFRLGQARSGGQADDAGRQVQAAVDRAGVPANPSVRPAPRNPVATNTNQPQSDPPATTADQNNAAPAVSQGDHWIVLQQWKTRDDLVPVEEHYARHGIKLLIVPLDEAPALFAKFGLNASALPSGTGYLLVTEQAYNNPKIAGTDGFGMVQEIARVGALYKAPVGRESFARHHFKDAYGMKIR